jgi:hypothetical protein
LTSSSVATGTVICSAAVNVFPDSQIFPK